jgi:hypothetical protein
MRHALPTFVIVASIALIASTLFFELPLMEDLLEPLYEDNSYSLMFITLLLPRWLWIIRPKLGYVPAIFRALEEQVC